MFPKEFTVFMQLKSVPILSQVLIHKPLVASKKKTHITLMSLSYNLKTIRAHLNTRSFEDYFSNFIILSVNTKTELKQQIEITAQGLEPYSSLPPAPSPLSFC